MSAGSSLNFLRVSFCFRVRTALLSPPLFTASHFRYFCDSSNKNGKFSSFEGMKENNDGNIDKNDVSSLIAIYKKMKYISNRFLICLPFVSGCIGCSTLMFMDLTFYDVLLMSIIPCVCSYFMSIKHRTFFMTEIIPKIDINRLEALLDKRWEMQLILDEENSEALDDISFMKQQMFIVSDIHSFLMSNYWPTIIPFIACAGIVACVSPFQNYILLLYPLSFYFFSPAFFAKSLRSRTRKLVLKHAKQ